MTPTELLDDHARRPRNIGKLLNASAVGDVGSIVIGDALRFYVGVAAPASSTAPASASARPLAEAIIQQAKFQVFNCSDQVAASSVVSELVIGKTLAEARSIGHGQVCVHLGGLDPAALPPRLWAVSGLQAAVAAYLGEELEHDQELDAILCRCYGVTEQTARSAVVVHGCTTPDQVVALTGAGTGCGTCRNDLPALIDEVHQKPAAPAPSAVAAGATGRIQTLLRIRLAVDRSLMPDVRAQGGDLELWDFDGRLVKVRALGTLQQDEPRRRAALEALEQLLRAEIDPALGVVDQT